MIARRKTLPMAFQVALSWARRAAGSSGPPQSKKDRPSRANRRPSRMPKIVAMAGCRTNRNHIGPLTRSVRLSQILVRISSIASVVWNVPGPQPSGTNAAKHSPRRPSRCRLQAAALQTALDLVHDLIDAEARGFLARRVFLEALQKLCHSALGGNQNEDVVENPIPVSVGGDVRHFIRIRTQVENLRHAQRHKRLGPDLHRSLGALFHEHDLEVVETHGDQVAVVVEVEELLARAGFLFAQEQRRHVVTVEVDLEVLLADLVAFQEFPLDVWLTGGVQEGRQPV